MIPHFLIVTVTRLTLENFGDISGLKLNRLKTKALWLGQWRHSKTNPLDFDGQKNQFVCWALVSLTMRKKMKNTTLH